MATPAPRGIGAVISPMARPPVAGPRITNKYGLLFRRTGCASGEANWPGVEIGMAFAAGAAPASSVAIATAARVALRMPFLPIFPGQIDACIGIRTYLNARVARFAAA